MADLLTHVLVAYVVLTAASWRFDRITSRWVAVGMGGAAIPDLGKVGILLDGTTVSSLLDVPFSWGPLGTLGGVLLVAGVVALAFAPRHRRRAYGFLVAGGVLSLLLDGLRVYADGRASSWLYPVTWWRPPTPNLYVSSDPRVLAVALVAAATVFAADRRLVDRASAGERER